MQGAGHELEVGRAYVAVDALHLRELWAWPAQPRPLCEKEPPCSAKASTINAATVTRVAEQE